MFHLAKAFDALPVHVQDMVSVTRLVIIARDLPTWKGMQAPMKAGFLQVDLGLGLAIIGWEEVEEYFGIILTLLPQFFRSLSPISLHRIMIIMCRQS